MFIQATARYDIGVEALSPGDIITFNLNLSDVVSNLSKLSGVVNVMSELGAPHLAAYHNEKVTIRITESSIPDGSYFTVDLLLGVLE